MIFLGYLVDHQHSIIITEDGEPVCVICGQVVYQTPSTTEETGTETETETETLKKHDTTGFIVAKGKRDADFTLQGSLSGRISQLNVDAHGNSVKRLTDLKRIRKWDVRVANTRHNADKSVRSAVWYITRLCETMKFSELIKERAAGLYRKAYSKGAVRGRSTKWIACSCLYYATKEVNIFKPATAFVVALECVEENSKEKLRIKNLFSAYKVLLRVLGVPAPPAISPLSELNRFATTARLSGVCVTRAVTIYNRIKEIEPVVFDGKNPGAIAICLLYIASKYNTEEVVGQRLLAAAGNISVVTLRKRTEEYVTILLNAGDKLPKELLRSQLLNVNSGRIMTGVALLPGGGKRKRQEILDSMKSQKPMLECEFTFAVEQHRQVSELIAV